MSDIASSTPRPVGDSSLPPLRSSLLDCDLVMKGGITSGVVYPKAIVRVAREYQVRSVGGTSVGAIAASLVAAAEYERQRHEQPASAWSGNLDAALSADLADEPFSGPAQPMLGRAGYGALYGIPADLGDNLAAKFQPSREMRSLFHYVFSWMQKFETPVGKAVSAAGLGLWWPRALTVLVGLLVFGGVRLLDPSGEGRFSLIAGAVITIAVIVAIRFLRPRIRLPLGLVVGIALVVSLLLARVIWSFLFGSSWRIFAGMGDSFSLTDAWDEFSADWQSVLVDVLPWVVVLWIAGAVLYLAWAVIRLLPRHDYGMCTGLGDSDAITNWMHESLNRVAGLDAGGESRTPVLTFGHLGGSGAGGMDGTPTRRAVRLQMIGTDLLRGVPLLLPDALTPDRRDDGTFVSGYLFDPARFRTLFPPEVVEELLDGASEEPGRLYPFPPQRRIPVVVAARMSMSFPILFAAVPVVYCDSEGRQWQTWISDGGIVSNFPSNLFDEALPPWPTFGLDLIDVDVPPNETAPAGEFMLRWLSPTWPYSRSSVTDNVERLPTQGISSVIGFLMAAVSAARGWIDNSQKRLPGYAERIVAMNIYPGEGGLNLTMEHEKIERLARRGLLAVNAQLEKWQPEGAHSQWRYHRWVRMRTLMRELEEVGRGWREWFERDPGAVAGAIESFEAMARDMPDPASPAREEVPYPIVHPDDQARARTLIASFRAFADRSGRADDGQGPVADAGASAGERAAIVFDAPVSPQPNPRLLLMPPFE